MRWLWVGIVLCIAAVVAGVVIDSAAERNAVCQTRCSIFGYDHGAMWRPMQPKYHWCSCWTTESGLVEVE